MNHANQHRGHALVTGASSGIGVAIASRLLRDGWYVTGLDRTEPIINGPYFSPLMLDLSDADAVRCALCTLKVNDLVHAAGILRFGELGSLDFAAGTDMWRVNVAAAMLLDDSGANASSRGPHRADRRPYCFRVRRPQPVCRHQVGAYRDGTFVGDGARAPRPSPSNVVSPTATKTPMLLDPAAAASSRLPPIGRFVQPEEVAAATAFLLSEEAAAITGQMVMCGRSSL